LDAKGDWNMDDLNSLRNFNDEDDDDFGAANEPEFDPVRKEEVLFLGMTAMQRMFLSILIFLIAIVFGIALLLFTNRIAF
jgi:hypothetical protein